MDKTKQTGEFYDLCWTKFSKEQNDEATQLLFKRMVLNKVPFSLIEEKSCLDIGCGSGRYSNALLNLGAKEVMGIDLNKPLLKNKNFSFKKGNALKLPFKDDSFEFVFCNGVLHHSRDWRKGIKEAVRVLKPDGWLWLYLVGDNKMRQLEQRIRKRVMKHKGLDKDIKEYLLARSWEPNKIFFLLDSFFPPHMDLLSKKETKEELMRNELEKIRYLEKYLEDVPPETHLRFIAKKKRSKF